MNGDPRERKPIPPLDVLILRRFLDRANHCPLSLSKELGEDQSNIKRWCDKFVKLGLLVDVKGLVGSPPKMAHWYCRNNHSQIREYVANRESK